MSESNPLAWRESCAVADMHCRLAAKKLNVVMTKDKGDPDAMLSELGKSIECIEAAHAAAMTAYDHLAHQARRAKSVRGVRLTSVREIGPLKAPIADLNRKQGDGYEK